MQHNTPKYNEVIFSTWLSLGYYSDKLYVTSLVLFNSTTWSVPKVMRMIFFLRSAEGQGKVSGGRGRRRGNPGIQFDPLSWVRAFVAVGTKAKCVVVFVPCHVRICRSLVQCYAIKFCAKLGKSGSKTLQLLRTAYGDAVLSSGGTGHSRTERRTLRTNSVQDILQLQELRTLWLVWMLFWIGTNVWMCG